MTVHDDDNLSMLANTIHFITEKSYEFLARWSVVIIY